MNEGSNTGGEGLKADAVPGYFVPVVTTDRVHEVDLAGFFGLLWRHKWLVLAIVFLTTALATAAAVLMTPVYRVEVVLMPASKGDSGDALSMLGGQFAGVASLAGINVGGQGSDTEEAIGILKSRDFTRRFIQDQGLMDVLYAGRPGGDAEAPTLNDGVRFFNKEVREVVRDKATGMVTLSVEWTDPALAADWANGLTSRVNAEMRQRAIDEARQSMEYLNAELRKTSIAEVQGAIYRLLENQIKTIMLANVREQYSFEVIDPAVAPDEDDFVRPNRPILVVLGFVLGLILAILLVLVLRTVRPEHEYS